MRERFLHGQQFRLTVSVLFREGFYGCIFYGKSHLVMLIEGETESQIVLSRMLDELTAVLDIMPFFEIRSFT